MNGREIEKLANIHAVHLLRGEKEKKQLIKKYLLVSCLKFTITVKLGKRVKTLEGNIDNSIENAERVCQY